MSSEISYKEWLSVSDIFYISSVWSMLLQYPPRQKALQCFL